jgi:hypothetical protein
MTIEDRHRLASRPTRLARTRARRRRRPPLRRLARTQASLPRRGPRGTIGR